MGKKVYDFEGFSDLWAFPPILDAVPIGTVTDAASISQREHASLNDLSGATDRDDMPPAVIESAGYSADPAPDLASFEAASPDPTVELALGQKPVESQSTSPPFPGGFGVEVALRAESLNDITIGATRYEGDEIRSAADSLYYSTTHNSSIAPESAPIGLIGGGGTLQDFTDFEANSSKNSSSTTTTTTTTAADANTTTTATPQTATTVSPSGNPYIDGLLSGSKWAGPITYSFPDSPSDYSSTNYYATNGFAQVSDMQQQAVSTILQQMANFTNLAVQYAGFDTADVRVGQSSAVSSTAIGYYPGTDGGGDIWFGTTYNYRSPVLGDYYYFSHIHELGHALGLKHSFTTPAVPADHDAVEFTVMSYRSYVGGPTTAYTMENYGYPTTFMMNDILALQYMYGADYNYNNTNTVYTWSPTTGEMFINGVGQGQPGANRIFLTIWDGGGIDTYDMSNYTTGVNIDLNPASYSTTSTVQLSYLGNGNYAHGNVYNAYLYNNDPRSYIESAIGGSGNDVIVGNAIGNILDGRSGNDILTGGAGNDVFVYRTGYGADTVTDFVASGSTKDTIDLSGLTGIYSLQDVIAHGTQVGTDTVLTFGAGQTLTLDNVLMSNLVSSDFIFGTSTSTNHAPTTSPVTLAPIAEDSGVRLITQAELLSQASDVDGQSLTATNLAIASGKGTIVNNGDGTWSYTPALNDDTSVSFSYSVTDGSLTAAGAASLDITPVNDAPTTSSVTLTAIAENSGARLITQSELLSNASDVDGPSLSATNLAIASGQGTLVNNGDGTWSYAPATNDSSSVTFSYTVTDGSLTAAGSAALDIIPVDQPPTTSPVALAAIAEDSGARLITQAELLSNASDPDGQALTATNLTIASGQGTLVNNGNGTWSYTPALNDDTSVSFNYIVTDGSLTAAGAATLDITPVNDAPTTSPVTLAAIPQGSTGQVITQAELLANASDVDGPSLTATNLAIASGQGTLVNNGDGTWTYTPAPNDDTSVNFSYVVTDGSLTAAGTATIDITPTDPSLQLPINQAPSAISLSNSSVQEELPGAIIGNISVSDPNGDSVFTFASSDSRFEVVTDSSGAYQLKLVDGVILDYETDPQVSISITATDSGGLSKTQSFDINVTDITGVTINGSSNADLIDASHTVPGQLYPTTENDTIYGAGGDDTIQGLAGNDFLSGDAGNDVLYGGDGDDTLIGGAGIDQLHGGNDNDVLVISGTGDQTDVLDGGAGTDTVMVTGTGAVTLAGFDATASSIEVWRGNGQAVLGTSGADRFDFSGLTSVSGLLYVDAGKGNDTIIGSKFNDDLRGGMGTDRIAGAAGDDVLSGGSGSDTFVFAAGFGRDTVTDFYAKTMQHDIIEFSKDVFASYAAVLAAAHQVGSDVVITASATDSITLKGVSLSKLTADDFRFV